MTQSRQGNWAVVLDDSGKPFEVQFQDWRCHVVMERYANGGGLSLRLVDAVDCSPIARATSSLINSKAGDDEVLIKNYSENAGVLEALVAAELITDTGNTVPSEYATLHQARLSPRLAQQWHDFRDQLDVQEKQR